MRTIFITLPPQSRNHLAAPCPECGGKLLDRSPGGVPGDVECESCPWQARHLGTDRPWEMEAGTAEARFEVTE